MKKRIGFTFAIGALLLTLSSCEIDTSLLPDHPDVIGSTTVTSHDHSYKETVVAPKCDEVGYTLYKCSCGAQYRENETAKLGHIVPEGYTVIKKADCQHNQTIRFICERCASEVEEEYGLGDHVLVSDENGIDAGCTEAGKTSSYHCSLCDYVKEAKTIPAKGHNYEYNVSLAATCTEKGYASSAICKRCGHAEGGTDIPALGHDMHEIKKVTAYGYFVVDECSRGDSLAFKESLVTDYTTNYDYVALGNTATYSNGAKYQKMYKSLYEQATTLLSSTNDFEADAQGYYKVGSYNYLEEGLSLDEAASIVTSFVINNPQFYFLTTGYVYSSKTIYLNSEAAYAKASVRKAIDGYILDMETSFYKEIYNKEYTDAEKAKVIHDFICNRIDYSYQSTGVPQTASWAHSMVGVAEERGGVCEAYARTYLYLSKLSGIHTLIVSGTGNGGGHAWNYTEINGKWYGVDVTWDDQNYGIITNYLLATKMIMDEEHTIGTSTMDVNNDTFQVPLPELTAVPLA